MSVILIVAFFDGADASSDAASAAAVGAAAASSDAVSAAAVGVSEEEAVRSRRRRKAARGSDSLSIVTYSWRQCPFDQVRKITHISSNKFREAKPRKNICHHKGVRQPLPK